MTMCVKANIKTSRTVWQIEKITSLYCNAAFKIRKKTIFSISLYNNAQYRGQYVVSCLDDDIKSLYCQGLSWTVNNCIYFWSITPLHVSSYSNTDYNIFWEIVFLFFFWLLLLRWWNRSLFSSAGALLWVCKHAHMRQNARRSYKVCIPLWR